MTSAFDNEAFWRGSDAYVAVNPHRVDEADGLFEYAASSEGTSSLIFFQTSGSEGFPKWCGLSREAMLASACAVNAHLESTSQDRWLIALPLYHVGGFSILARCFASGASFVQMNDKWDAAKFAELCTEKKITLTSLVPTQVFDLVQAQIHAPPSLRAVIVGGAGLSREIGIQARELGWPVLQSYGMTETASQVATSSLASLRGEFDPERLEVLTIWDLQTDEHHRLTVRGAALASGYAIRESGEWRWMKIDSSSGLRTRDRVEFQKICGERCLKFIGRESAFVKVLGELVNTEELQARLELFTDALHGVVVCAVPDARRGSKLVLAGELPMTQLEILRTRFNAGVTGVQKLEKSQVIPAMPRTALGKPDRMALIELMERL